MSGATLTSSLRQLLGRADAPDVAVSGIAMDSRRIRAGDAFLACAGLHGHGLEHVGKALSAGCSAVVYEPTEGPAANLELSVPAFELFGLNEKLGDIADRFYGRPSAAINVIGVTGTNGKTTVAWLISQCLQLLNMPCAYAGTLGYGLHEIVSDDGMTTPDVVESHRRLASLRDAGATHAAIEVSSHALDQHRLDGIRFKAAVFTNLSRDHLDYHGDMASYAAAKAKLFLEHDAEIKIINVDTHAGARLAAQCKGAVTTVSMVPDADASLVVRSAEPSARGFELSFDSAWGQGDISLPLLGTFNVENAALVLAVMLSLGVPVADAGHALENIKAPPGRLQSVGDVTPRVVVDYAHTPDALESALKAVRVNCSGALWCVFGCGGDRDRGKRPLMGRTAERLAQRLVVTNDNPRSESPSSIISDIVSGLKEPQSANVIEDRASAIGWSISNAADEDIVLIAGKGHEAFQQIGEQKIPFSDAAVAAACLEKRRGART